MCHTHETQSRSNYTYFRDIHYSVKHRGQGVMSGGLGEGGGHTVKGSNPHSTIYSWSEPKPIPDPLSVSFSSSIKWGW